MGQRVVKEQVPSIPTPVATWVMGRAGCQQLTLALNFTSMGSGVAQSGSRTTLVQRWAGGGFNSLAFSDQYRFRLCRQAVLSPLRAGAVAFGRGVAFITQPGGHIRRFCAHRFIALPVPYCDGSPVLRIPARRRTGKCEGRDLNPHIQVASPLLRDSNPFATRDTSRAFTITYRGYCPLSLTPRRG